MLRGSSGRRSSTCRVMTPRPSSSRQFFGLLQPLMRFIWPSLTGLTPIVERQHIILVDQGLCEGKSIAMLHLRWSQPVCKAACQAGCASDIG
eukprot:s3826_g7.t1